MTTGLSRGARNVKAFRVRIGFLVILIVAALAAVPAQARFTQQGGKLFGSGAVGDANQGASVALSADGETAIVGGFADNGNAGAAWVFARIGGVWTQQGPKLIGTGVVNAPLGAQQGTSVALSADGNTAIVGGNGDDGGAGAVWVFTRDEDGVWTQQGGKLVGTGAVGKAGQGNSVALSADGSTAIVGGPDDDGSTGAVWVFTRSGGVWMQQGGKLAGVGAVGAAFQGASVALSADGNIALVGGSGDNSGAGAVWAFTRGVGVWTQQGSKLVGNGAAGLAGQGVSVALSADGDTAVVGGQSDNGGVGAVWVFTRSGGVWTQQGAKLVGAGAVGIAVEGGSVALSADGNRVIVGGSLDNGLVGAAWVFRRNRAGVWAQFGHKLVGVGAAGTAFQGASVALSGDGSTVMVGGPGDNGDAGAAWVFGRPAATEVTPNAGTVDGGTNVLVLGSNFNDVVSVTFGGVPATDVFEVDPGAILATTPPHQHAA